MDSHACCSRLGISVLLTFIRCLTHCSLIPKREFLSISPNQNTSRASMMQKLFIWQICNMNTRFYVRKLISSNGSRRLLRLQASTLSSPRRLHSFFNLDFLISPTLIVMRLAHANLYTQAMATARSLKIDMTDLFAHLTNQCVRLTREPNLVMCVLHSQFLFPSHSCYLPGSRIRLTGC